MERQLLKTLLLTLASTTFGWDGQLMGQSGSLGASHTSNLQSSNSGALTTLAAMGVTETLATSSTVITTTEAATSVTTLNADDVQEGRTAASASTMSTSSQDMSPATTAMTYISKNQVQATHSKPTQPIEAAITTGQEIMGETTMPETNATSITSTLIPTTGENTNSFKIVNGIIKAPPTASLTLAASRKKSLLKNPEGTVPDELVASAMATSTVKAAESLMVSMSKNLGGEPIPPHSMGTATHSGTKTSAIISMGSSSMPTIGIPCALDEYPSTNVERNCMCNSSHYAYSEMNNVIVSLYCRPWEMEVSLSQCLLETHGWLQRDALFPGCSGVSKIIQGRRVITFVVKRKEGTCGLKLTTNSSHALYTLNTLLPPAALDSGVSNGSSPMNFSCAYPLVVNVSQKEPLKPTSLHTNIHVPGTGDSIITLSIFTDAHYSSLLVDQPMALHTPLYVILEATNADPERFVLVVNTFFASTNASGALAPETSYHFVKHSCPVGERWLTQLSTNGVSLKVKLILRLFRFLTSDLLYFHSHVILCDKQGNSSCQPTCTGMSQKQRSLPELEHQDKDKSGWLMFGPVQFQDFDLSYNRASAGSMRIWLTFLLLVISGMLT